MKKRICFVFICLLLVSTVGLFAQTSSAKNWISGEVSLMGVGVRYEYMLNPGLSIGVNAYWNTLFWFWNEVGVDISARWYPNVSWGGPFFVGLALGYHIHTGTYEYTGTYGGTYEWFGSVTGGAITPELGWKVDVGDAAKFYLQPGIKFPITLGVLEAYGASDSGFRLGFGIVIYLGMGYAF